MSDDLDDLLRAAMKTLDDQVPSGYFEGLPNRTLMRLEDSSMQTTGTSDSNLPTAGVPPQERDEDSGLHDIRSMASSAKMRISSKRITTNPPVDDDILASSSAGWKAVALPEPARMVSLPSIEQPVEEVKPSSERKSKKEIKAATTSASKLANAAIAVETSASVSASMSPAPAAKPDVSVTPIIGARFAQQQKKSKAGLYALIGTGLAAAAGVGWYVSTQMVGSSDSASEQVAVASQERAQPTAAPTPVAVPAAEPAPAPAPADEKATDTAVATGMVDLKDDGAAGAALDDGASGSKRGNTKAAAKQVKKDTDGKDRDAVAAPEKKADPAPKPDPKKGDGEVIEGEPSFDALLKEAGVQDKKPVKVALDKKSLSGADIKKGMSSVGGKAQACYAGTQGTAQVKLTVAPSGAVQKVKVTGVFAGTPVGACVEAAVKGATFPPWDGGPQSFGYSYLLAE